jgi:hypothetical protein
MNLIHTLHYFCHSLGCDGPVLEALWITGARREFELSRVLPAIEDVLASGQFQKNIMIDEICWTDTLYRSRYVWLKNNTSTFIFHVNGWVYDFGISVEEPRTVYFRQAPFAKKREIFPTQRAWLAGLLQFLSGRGHVKITSSEPQLTLTPSDEPVPSSALRLPCTLL